MNILLTFFRYDLYYMIISQLMERRRSDLEVKIRMPVGIITPTIGIRTR